MQLTDRPINKILNNDNNINLNNISDNYSNNNINSNSIGDNFFLKDIKFYNSQLSNINKNSLSHIINSNSKSNILSKTDRKINSNTNLGNNPNNNNNANNINLNINNSNNNRQTSDLNNYSSKILNYGINTQNIIMNKNINLGGLNNKDNQNKSIKPKIPTLKFPLDKTLPHQKFSLIRSSHRNDFSRSGDGSSTTTTKNKIFTNKLAEGSSMNRHFSQDVLILEPKEKLKELALQLGESCLATDFTSLINQKRDYLY